MSNVPDQLDEAMRGEGEYRSLPDSLARARALEGKKMKDWRQDKTMRRAFAAECAKYPRQLVAEPLPRGAPANFLGAWRSRGFLVQLYASDIEGGPKRLTVNRTELKDNGGWAEGITWDELQRLKREAGFGHLCAVEIFPPDGDVVNVSNMRHLWLLEDVPAYAWRKGAA